MLLSGFRSEISELRLAARSESVSVDKLPAQIMQRYSARARFFHVMVFAQQLRAKHFSDIPSASHC